MLTLTLALLLTHADTLPRECLQAGWDTGLNRGKLFCDSLEQHYRTGRRIWQQPVPVQFCEVLIAHACRDGMRSHMGGRSLCSQLVNDDWQGSRADFDRFLELACPIPEVVACPFQGAEVYKYVWCRRPGTGDYYAYYGTTWWRFLRSTQDAQGDHVHTIQADDGAVANVYSSDLKLVSSW